MNIDDKYYIKSLGFYNLSVKQLNFCFEKILYLYRPHKKFNFFNKITFGYKFVNLTYKNRNDSITLVDDENDFLCLIGHFFRFLIDHYYQCCPALEFLPINDELTISYDSHPRIGYSSIVYLTLNFKDNPLVKLIKPDVEQIYLTYKTLSYKLLLG